MKNRLTDSQVLFCILFSLFHNENLYDIKNNFFKKKLILSDSIKYCHNQFDDEVIYNKNYNFDSIIKLINYNLFMNFGRIIGDENYELKLLTDFRKFNVHLNPNVFNDINFILDFWYSISTNIFDANGKYKNILSKAIQNSTTAEIWKTDSEEKILKYKNSSRIRINYVQKHLKIGDISNYILSHIENELGEPDWQQKPEDILKRLRYTNSYSNSILNLAEFIFSSTLTDKENIFLSEITNVELVNTYRC